MVTPPMIVSPLLAPTPGEVMPARREQLADVHVASTELGFEKGIGPAVGRQVTWRDREYEVTEVAVAGGGPSFSGGSRFAIAPAGRGLMIGLKELAMEKIAALPAGAPARSL